jgi:hypothetical protein
MNKYRIPPFADTLSSYALGHRLQPLRTLPSSPLMSGRQLDRPQAPLPTSLLQADRPSSSGFPIGRLTCCPKGKTQSTLPAFFFLRIGWRLVKVLALPPAPLPRFLAALSGLVGRGVLPPLRGDLDPIGNRCCLLLHDDHLFLDD